MPRRLETPQQRVDLLVSAKEIIRTVEPINGQDGVGTQDLIKTVKRARLRCSKPDMLLDFLFAEKIVDRAKRSIGHV